MKRILRVLTAPWGAEGGVALPLALIALLVLGALSAALLTVGSSEVQIAANHLRGTQAHFLAEAGIERAVAQLMAQPSLVTSATSSLQTLFNDLTLEGAGRYTVQYQSAGPNTVLVVSTATSAVGSAQKVLRAIMSTAFTSDNAIRTKGDLTISGNPTITGTCGSAHTNEDFSISGNPTVTGSATASATYNLSGSPAVGPGSGGGKPLKPIPAINPLDFLAAAKTSLPASQIYQMKSDGRVLDGNDNVITTLASGAEFNGWEYTSGTPTKWDFHGNTGFDGTYYLEGNAKISGNPGSVSTPWSTTIIATGDIDLSGNPEISSHLTDTLLVAGLDIEISGNPTQGFTGLIAAHEQIKISGNPAITGYIIAEDATSTSATVTENRVSGNPTITYQCGLNPPLQGPLQILAWGS